MDIKTILSVLSLLGIGTALGTFLRIIWERKQKLDLQKQDFKFNRYKAITILLYSALNFDDYEQKQLRKHGRDFKSKEEIMRELKVEWHNMILFASDEVLYSMQNFIKTPDSQNFNRVTIAFRKDLWGSKSSFVFEDVDL